MKNYSLQNMLDQINKGTFDDTRISIFRADDPNEIHKFIETLKVNGTDKKVQHFECTEGDLHDYTINLSTFSSLKSINMQHTKIKNLPNIGACPVEIINMKHCGISELPNISGCVSTLKLLYLNHNPLSADAIEQAKKLSSRKRGGLLIKFSNENATGNITDETLKHCTVEKIIELFVNLVDKTDKDEADIIDINVVSKEFNERTKSISECDIMEVNHDEPQNSFSKQLIGAISRAQTDPLFHSRLRIMFSYCLKMHASTEIKSTLHRSFEYNYGLLHCISNDVWLPDFSFLSGLEPVQPPIGKKRHNEKQSPFPKSMLIPMAYQLWNSDNIAAYYSTADKKRAKLRKKDKDHDFVLYREIDVQGNLEHVQQGNYIYALSLNGGLIIADSSSGSHSNLRAGQYVICAGHTDIDKDGKITMISSESGHMTPNSINLICAVTWLYKRGFIDENCKIINMGGTHVGVELPYGQQTSISVKDFLDNKHKYIKDCQALNFIKNMLSIQFMKHTNQLIEPETIRNIGENSPVVKNDASKKISPRMPSVGSEDYKKGIFYNFANDELRIFFHQSEQLGPARNCVAKLHL